MTCANPARDGDLGESCAQGYVLLRVDDEPVGIILRRADGSTRTRPQCSWCEDVTLPNDVMFFAAKRAVQAGRNGDTVGTLVCVRDGS